MRRGKGQPRYTGSFVDFKVLRLHKLHPAWNARAAFVCKKKTRNFPMFPAQK